MNEYSVQEYLWEEQRSEVKREFYAGKVYAMAGGSPNHSRIATNLIAGLALGLRGKNCEAFNSDLKIGMTIPGKKKSRASKKDEEDFITYPDVSIICGKLEYFKGDRYTVSNPVVLFEVLSPSTRNYDRSFKLDLYQKIPTLKTYVMVDSEKIHVEYYSRLNKDEWLQRTIVELEDALSLEGFDISLSVEELYARVEFETEE